MVVTESPCSLRIQRQVEKRILCQICGQPELAPGVVGGDLVLEHRHHRGLRVQHPGDHHLPALVEGVECRVSQGVVHDVGVEVVEGDVGQDGAGHLLVEALHLQTRVRCGVNLPSEPVILNREEPQHKVNILQ